MKYTSKKGTVINIPDGLTAKQIAAIKADADSGYGKRAQQTANDLGKKLTTTKPGKTTPVTTATVSKGTVSTSGTIDPVKASEDIGKAEEGDIKKNFDLGTPGTQVDSGGNTRHTVMNPDGTVSVTDSAGSLLQTFQNQAQAAAAGYQALDLSGAPAVSGGTAEDRARVEDANYSTLTRFYDRDQGRENEAAKQELANRGIPYDPAAAQDVNTKNLYGRTIGGIDQKYQGLKADAANRSIALGNDTLLANTSASNTANQAFVNAAVQQHTGNLNGIQTLTGGVNALNPAFQGYTGQTTDMSGATQDLIQLSSAAYLQKYGIDKDEAIKRAALAKSGSTGTAKTGTTKAKAKTDNSNTPIVTGSDASGFEV